MPNILLLCTDQHRFDVLGCYGNSIVKTPAIDGLAAEGTRFERCYAPSPVCAPTRASMLTGLFPHAHGLWANGVALPPGRPLLGRLLADGGYDCGLIGKLHIAACFQGRTEPRSDDGFRFFEWAHDPTHSSPDNRYHQWLQREFPELCTGPAGEFRINDDMPTRAHYSHWVAEESIRFLREARDPQKPFFLMANFYDPHHPFVAPKSYVDKYRGRVPAPIRPVQPDDRKPAIQDETSLESYAGHAPGFASYSPEQLDEALAAYYGMVDLIDDEVGRILGALADAGLADDTLVVFTSDHGEMLGDHGQMLKGPLFYEGAVRVPMLLRWPGHVPVGVSSELVQAHDIFSTFLRAADLPVPDHAQTLDLLALARGEQPARSRGWALTEYRDSGHPLTPPVHATMLRADRYKVVVHHGEPSTTRPSTGELYDLAQDPRELTNRWDDPAFQSIRQQLVLGLLDALVGTEDRSATRDAFW